MGYRLGIDLGTTFTAAASVEDQTPRMLELGNRNVSVPSVLFVAEDGQLLIGEAAERRAGAEPERVIREFKRRFGDDVPLVVANHTFDPVQLQIELLRWVLRSAVERQSAPPDHVVVTHPANWGPYKMQLMRDMVTAAGVPGATLCPEPVAAAVEYAAKRRVPDGAKLAVYDLGGGTFDVAVLEKTDAGFTILGTPLGIDHLGGSDFTEAVFAEVLASLDLADLDLDDPVVTRGINALRRECVEAKEALSSDVDTEISSLLPGAVRTVRFTRAELEGLIRPALLDTVSSTVRALRLAGLQNSEVDAIVLVGGSSRIPLVTELLSREIGVPVALDTYPKNDIALGAARYAALQNVREPEAAVPPPTPAAPVSASSPATPEQPLLGPPLIGQEAERSGDPAFADRGPSGAGLPPPATTPGAATPPGPVPAWMAGSPMPVQPMPVQPVPFQPVPVQPAGDEPAEAPGRRRILIGIVVAAVVIALGVTGGLVIDQLRGSTRVGGPITAAPTDQASGAPTDQASRTPTTQASPGPTAATSESVKKLPVGKPLSDDQLLAPLFEKAGGPGRLWLIDTADPDKSRDLEATAEAGLYAVGLSPDRRTITYIDAAANAVRTIASSGGDSQVLFEAPDGCGQLQHASWSPTDLGAFVVECQVSGGPKRLLVVRIDGTVERVLDTGQRQSADPAISPDGTKVAFWGASTLADGDGGSIFVMPIDASSPPRAVTRGKPGVDADPAWSPDGTSLAIRRRTRSAPRNADVLVIPAAGGPTRTILSGPANDEKPGWSPDGRMIIAVSNRDDRGEPTDGRDLWRIDSGGGDPVSLGVRTYRISTPTWSRR